MPTAHELPTLRFPGVERRAYRLDPPFVDAHGRALKHVVLSNNFREVRALEGHLAPAPEGGTRVEIAHFDPRATLQGVHRIRGLLTEMGYETVVDLDGHATVLTRAGMEAAL